VALATAEEFARQNVQTVRFYQIDSDRNALPALPQHFRTTSPSFLLWPAVADKAPLMFSGESDVLELMTLLMTHAKSRFSFQIPRKYDAGAQEL
jgi:hypothetical protein